MNGPTPFSHSGNDQKAVGDMGKKGTSLPWTSVGFKAWLVISSI